MYALTRRLTTAGHIGLGLISSAGAVLIAGPPMILYRLSGGSSARTVAPT
jgi:hypothetical protein